MSITSPRIYTGLMGEFSLQAKHINSGLKSIYASNQQPLPGGYGIWREIPQGIRRGQTLQIRLALSDETTALFVQKRRLLSANRGVTGFSNWMNQTLAYKVDIQLGRQNPDYYEVLGGLKQGDKVVVSSYENYGNMQSWYWKVILLIILIYKK